MLKRKIDIFLNEWKKREDRLPLIIKGSRQIGKTTSIRLFAFSHYESIIEINFIENIEYKDAFKNNNVDDIIKQLSLYSSSFIFNPGKTLIFLDEVQVVPDILTSLKFFKEDGRFDVICSGSLLGINYKNINSIAVGFKEDYTMYSLDFEEFLWAKGYTEKNIEYIYSYMKEVKKLPTSIYNKLQELFKEYIYCGGMPRIVNTLVTTNLFTTIFAQQEQLYKDYEDDICNYVQGLDVARVENVYRHITPQLAKDNHKFQISKLGHGARFREYRGCQEWLKDAGIVNVAYNLNDLSLPLKGNEIEDYFRIYYADTSLLIASIDEESKKDFIINNNFEIYNGALFESLVSEALIKAGYKDLFFYKSTDSTKELDFVVRVKNEIVPIEVKSKKGNTKSLKSLLDEKVINYGVKLSQNNIGFDGRIFTFPYFLTFLIKKFFDDTDFIKW